MNPKIQFLFPIESISRKLTLRKNTASTNGKVNTEDGVKFFTKEVSRYIGAGQRSLITSLAGEIKKNYVFIRFNQRTAPLSADEILVRNHFTTGAKLAKKWKNDLVHLQTYNALWRSGATRAGVSAAGMTYFGWLVAVGIAVAQNGGTPQSEFPSE